MKILVLNGSPHIAGNTSHLIDAFRRGAEDAGHTVITVLTAQKKISGCKGCEYCHFQGHGECIQKDDMQQIYPLMKKADMLVLASPIYYRSFSSQLKCVIDRFYAIAFPKMPENLKKIALILSSGAPNVYGGATYIYEEEFLQDLRMEGMGVYTACKADVNTSEKLNELYSFGNSL